MGKRFRLVFRIYSDELIANASCSSELDFYSILFAFVVRIISSIILFIEIFRLCMDHFEGSRWSDIAERILNFFFLHVVKL